VQHREHLRRAGDDPVDPRENGFVHATLCLERPVGDVTTSSISSGGLWQLDPADEGGQPCVGRLNRCCGTPIRSHGPALGSRGDIGSACRSLFRHQQRAVLIEIAPTRGYVPDLSFAPLLPGLVESAIRYLPLYPTIRAWSSPSLLP